MSVFTDYADRIKALDPDTYIGQIVWYTVAEGVQAKQADIQAALALVGLSEFTPKPPSDSDVFRRCATAAAQKRVPTSTPGVVANYLVRDPGSKGALIVRRIVRELVDSNNQRLSFDEVAEVRFDRTTAGVDWSILALSEAGPVDLDTVRGICNGIKDGYDAERGCLNGYAIRELIRRTLIANNATNVRYPAGGVYFLSLAHAPAIAGLEDALSTLDGVSIHPLPLIDDGKQRSMLKKAFEAESVDRAQAMITEIAELQRAGKKIGKERYATFVTELGQLNGKLGEYGDLLQTGLSTTSASLRLLQRSVVGLMALREH